MATLDLRSRLGDVSLRTIIATLGAPLEVTAANVAIEAFLPADAESAARLRNWPTCPSGASRRRPEQAARNSRWSPWH
jgi:hypothetical protein